MKISVLKALTVMIFFFANIISAQQKELSIFFEGGIASSGGFGFNVSGSGGTMGPWKSGYQISIGAEYPFYKNFSLRGMINYSWHPFDEMYSYGLSHSNSKLTYTDLLADLKLNLGWFFFNGGIGLSSQSADEIRFWDNNGMENLNFYSPQKSKFLISGIVGIGLDIEVFERFSLLIECSLYMREYMGSAFLGGLKYRLE